MARIQHYAKYMPQGVPIVVAAQNKNVVQLRKALKKQREHFFVLTYRYNAFQKLRLRGAFGRFRKAYQKINAVKQQQKPQQSSK